MIEEKLIFELDSPGRKGYSYPKCDVPFISPEKAFGMLKRSNPCSLLPELSEVDVVRHFTRLSMTNYGVDTGLYPLGSCTMKYNPKINEAVAKLHGFSSIHPLQHPAELQGALRMMYELSSFLCSITGMDGCTLQPAAGAHGELAGMLIISACHKKNGNKRKVVLIPDSAHGTNPSSAHLAGFRVEEIKSASDGCIDVSYLKERMGDDVAAIMLTIPNTLGIFEKNIDKICKIVHDKGAIVYIDGANMNALMGQTRPGDWGADVIHLNLHKTFSTPHGGGGPGAGPVAVKSHLIPYLPLPTIEQKNGAYTMNWNNPESIGKIHSFFGNFGILVRAYAYILTMGAQGLKSASELAVLNANYLRTRLKTLLHLPYDSPTLHEVVFSDQRLPNGITTLDLAKALIDRGFHPPTIYFPLIVHGSIMIEPTETEPIEELDRFIEAMNEIVKEASENPEALKNAPRKAYRRRLDEVSAARNLRLTYKPE